MIHVRCLSTELLLERIAPAPSHGERLRVEAHLLQCTRCHRDHRGMLKVVGLIHDRIENVVKPQVQARAIARALLRSRDAVGSGVLALPGAVRFGLGPKMEWRLAIATACVVLVAGSGLQLRLERGEAASLLTASHLVSGALAVNGSALGPGDAIPTQQELASKGSFVVDLAHARLSAEHVDSFRWSAAERAVTMRGAVVNVSVDPSRHQSFRVITPHFMVDVLGTQFKVALDTVAVTRGRVRVLSAAGAPLAELGPGQVWSYVAPASALAALDTARGGPESVVVATDAAELGSVANSAPDTIPAVDAAAAPPVGELLLRARHRLASGDAQGAAVDLDAALRGGASRSQQAEAYMLKGDCALVQRDSRSAVRQYLDVSRRFAASPMAETALFAAARVEWNSGSNEAARGLLHNYRVRYPTGLFKSEVDARLRILESQ